MKLDLYPIQEICHGHWDKFVQESNQAWFWHLFDFQDCLAQWPETKNISFAVTEEEKILAVMPLHLVTRRILSLPIRRLESLGGLAIDTNLSPKAQKTVFKLAFDHLKSLQRKLRAWETNISLSAISPEMTIERPPRVNPLGCMGFEPNTSHSWIVDLRKSEEDIFKSYSETTRNEIRRWTKSEPVIREAKGPSDLITYFKMHEETCRRTGAKPHLLQYFQYIFEKFIPKGQARIVFLENNGKVVAAQNTCLFKQRACYWTGASLSEKSGGEAKLLCHRQMLHAKEQGCEFYEMGEAFPHLNTGKQKGLSDFKRSLGGELYPLYRGALRSETKLLQLGIAARMFWRDSIKAFQTSTKP